MAEPTGAAAANEVVFTISREFDAPRDLVWKAWTEPERLSQWWGPQGFTVRVANLDLRPEGSFHYCLQGPDGQQMWGKFFYREIVAPERLVFINCFSDEQGGVVRPPFDQDWPREMLSTITFAERDGRTTITVRWVPWSATEAERQTFAQGLDSMRQGWSGTFEQLAAYLARA